MQRFLNQVSKKQMDTDSGFGAFSSLPGKKHKHFTDIKLPHISSTRPSQ